MENAADTDNHAEKRAGARRILILGASYGSLLATKLVLAGHEAKLQESCGWHQPSDEQSNQQRRVEDRWRREPRASRHLDCKKH